ncbi:hypothetical protein GCM10023347_38310 [Streptomyces chumphonensis]|uniref:Uncharacterized protein n=1 Tax=Streptomyces chumphonensis TaxID=1214925 RepID=A0A927EXL9_9ACTN|nr:hypothetical protein [Streptomyces chumphonensis]MBD3930637.1 hypothetical protein [Streptomyces chumphonensis]
MTVPDGNRPKTEKTENAPRTPSDEPGRTRPEDSEHGATGRTMREALEEADVRPEDYEEG